MRQDMDIWLSILTMTLAYVVVLMTPGPNFLVTVKNSITFSRYIGFYTVVGIVGGTFFHVVAGFLGLTAVIWRVTWLFSLAKIMGAAYLTYLGYKAFRNQAGHLKIDYQKDSGQLPKSKAIKMGFYTCLSNPKSALSYLSLFTAVIPAASPLWAQMLMILIMLTLSLIWYTSVAFLFSQSRIQRGFARVERPLNYLLGSLFIGLGIKLAFVTD